MPYYQPPQRFPGLNRLPKAAGDLISALFPKDTLPMPGVVLGPKTPVAVPQGKSLLEAFRPWGKGLEKAHPEMYGPSAVPVAPNTSAQMGEAFENYNQLLAYLLQKHGR